MTESELREILNLAEEANIAANYSEAERLANEVLTAILNSGNTKSKEWSVLQAQTLYTLGVSARRASNYTKALERFTEALTISEAVNDKDGIAKATGVIGLVHEALSDFELALQYYKKALALDDELGNKKREAVWLGFIGNAYGRLSNYEHAMEHHSRALTINQEHGNKLGMSSNYGNLGVLHHNLADHAKALEYHSKSLAIDEEMDNKLGLATVMGNLANVHYSLSDYDRALNFYEKAMALNKEIGNQSGVARNLANMGNLYADLDEYGRALTYLEQALALDAELGNKDGMARQETSIAYAYFKLHDFKKAMEYYQSGFRSFKELGIKVEVGRIKGQIGTLYAAITNPDFNAQLAEEYLLDSIASSEELKIKNYEVHKTLAELYEQQERWKEFAFHYRKHHALKEEVKTDEATKQVQLLEHRRKIEEAERNRQVKLARFQEQEKILHNMLPAQIADRMVGGEKTIADSYEQVSVFFSDIVGFTKLSQRISAEDLVVLLNQLFREFDRIARKHGLEKIKTIGDAYMAVSGAPVHQTNHSERAALFALEVIGLMREFRTGAGEELQIRIGLHCGNAVAGIIGETKFAYDLWGDAVNTASRMESHGEPGKIQVSEDFVHSVKQHSQLHFAFEERGEIEVKGKGKMKTYFLTSKP